MNAAPLTAIFVLLGSFSLAASSASGAGHPVEKVITLLKGLADKVDSEGKEEALTFEKFEYWAKNAEKTLSKSIAEGKASLDKLDSEIAAHKTNIAVLAEGIEGLTAELAQLAKADSAADADRTADQSLYTQESQALKDTIKAIADAITALSDTKDATDSLLLAQQQHVRVALALIGTGATLEQRSALEQFASPERPDLKVAGNYEEHVKRYSFKSNSVVELLKELQAKFEEELLAVNKAETNAVNAYQLAKEARKNLKDAAEASKAAKTTEKASEEAGLAAAEGAFADTTADLQADTATLEETLKGWQVKKSEWAERSELRAGEQAAIKAAIEILAKVTGVRTEAPGNPVPPPSPVSFLQLPANPGVARAVQLLRKEATVAHSKALEQLAAQIAQQPGSGPFDAAINSIQKLIFHLQNEQREEDDHKNWCDLELDKTNTSIVDKDAKVHELTIKIEDADATITTLTADIATANQLISDIVAHEKEATEIREIGKKENALAIKDAQDAQTALANAISVLKTYYKESGAIAKESWEFLQRARAPVELPDTPATWSSSYTGVADPAAQPGGIVSVLSKVSADFAEMEADTSAQEKTDQDAYKADMQDCEIEKARRTKEVEMKEQEKGRVIEKKTSLEATRKGVQGELEATQQYLKDLQPACVEGDSTYEDRKAARATEIEALHEAQDLLTNAFAETTPAPASFLQGHRRMLRGA